MTSDRHCGCIKTPGGLRGFGAWCKEHHRLLEDYDFQKAKADEVVRRYGELEQRSAWRKIDAETPKETVIVYALPHPRRSGEWSVGLAYRSVSGNWHNTEDGWERILPTHWMPLPEPPR